MLSTTSSWGVPPKYLKAFSRHWCKCRLLLGVSEFQIEHPAVGLGDNEGIQPVRLVFPYVRVSEMPPIDLHLSARLAIRCVHRPCVWRLNSFSRVAEIARAYRNAPGKALCVQVPEDNRRRRVRGVFFQKGIDHFPVRVQL